MMKKIRIEHLFILFMFVLFAGFIGISQKDLDKHAKMHGVFIDKTYRAPVFNDNPIYLAAVYPAVFSIYFTDMNAKIPYPPLMAWLWWKLAKNNVDALFILEGDAPSGEDQDWRLRTKRDMESAYDKLVKLTRGGTQFTGFLIMCSLFILIFQLINSKTGSARIKFLSGMAFMFSSIFMFVYDNGNIIIYSLIFLTFFIFHYKSEKRIIRELAILSLALAVATKPYVCFMGMLLLFDREWKLLMRAALYSFLLVFIPFFLADIPPEIPVSGTMDKYFMNVFAWIERTFHYGRGLSFPASIGGNVFTPEIRAVLNLFIYAICIMSSILAVISAPFLKGKENEWKKVCLTVCSFIVLARGGTAIQYCFIFLFPCIVMFLNSNTKINLSNMVYLIAFVLILNPVQFGRVSGITISWFFVKISFWIIFFHLIFDGFKELLKEKDWRKRIWFLNRNT